jgi:AcrR family transcriptional regulator
MMEACKVAGRREQQKAERRARLFDAAMALFAARGFDAVSVADITDAAGLSKGVFFNYFPTKGHALGAFQTQMLDGLLSFGEQVEPAGCREVFEVFFGEAAVRYERDAALVRQVVLHMRHQPSMLSAEQDTAQRVVALYGGWLEQGIAAGELAADTDVAVVTQLVGDLWLGALVRWARDPSMSLAGAIGGRLGILFDGLTSRGSLDDGGGQSLS